MQVTINGDARDLELGTTITGLLKGLDITADRVAVELDRAIVKRTQWETTELRDGAKIEIVHFVGGG